MSETPDTFKRFNEPEAVESPKPPRCSWCEKREATHDCAGCGDRLCDTCEQAHVCSQPPDFGAY